MHVYLKCWKKWFCFCVLGFILDHFGYPESISRGGKFKKKCLQLFRSNTLFFIISDSWIQKKKTRKTYFKKSGKTPKRIRKENETNTEQKKRKSGTGWETSWNWLNLVLFIQISRNNYIEWWGQTSKNRDVRKVKTFFTCFTCFTFYLFYLLPFYLIPFLPFTIFNLFTFQILKDEKT